MTRRALPSRLFSEALDNYRTSAPPRAWPFCRALTDPSPPLQALDITVCPQTSVIDPIARSHSGHLTPEMSVYLLHLHPRPISGGQCSYQ